MPLSKNPQHAVSPANAILNYYTIPRVEARLAAATLGMEPGLGIFHATRRWRDSFTLDLMEPIRPLVDDVLLDMLKNREFSRSDFFETRRGVVRIMPPLSHELSSTADRWAGEVAPLTEQVARELMDWADAGSPGAMTRTQGHGRDRQRAWVSTRLTGEYRSKGKRQEQRQRRRSALESWEENQKWEQEHGGKPVAIDCKKEILPYRSGLKLREITEATRLSISYAAAIRNGREVPHRRHWPPVAAVIQEKRERLDQQRRIEERWADVDSATEIRPKLESVEIAEIAERISCSESYAGRIKRGQKIPALKHWDALNSLAVTSDTYVAPNAK